MSMLDNLKQMAGDALEAAQNLAETAVEKVKDVADDVAGSDLVAKATEMAGDALESAQNLAEGAVEKVKDVAEDVMSSDVVTKATEMAGNAVETVKDKAADLMGGDKQA